MAGSFRIERIFGAGAFGTVCLVRDLSHPHAPRVVAKVLHRDYVANADVRRRTRDEARMLHRLRHPHVVRVHWLMEFSGRPVLGMEWVDGASLDRLLTRQTADHPAAGLPVGVALSAVRAAASALDAAYHSPSGPGGQPMRIIHRDVKPANLLMSTDGVVKVADFGQAKGEFIDREAVSLEIVLGSRAYMAPERVGGTDTPAGDSYALGLTLFELLTGRPVVVSLHPEKHQTGVEKHRGWLPADGLSTRGAARIRDLFTAACQYDPEARPTPAEIAAEAERALATLTDPVDLAAYAARAVQPARAATPDDPRAHPAWADVAFLETERGDVVEVGTAAAEAQAARARAEALLDQPDWARHADELRALFAELTEWAPPALVDVVERAAPSWWWPFAARPDDREIALALELLRGRADAAVVDRARRLVHHRDPAVAEHARELLAAGPTP